MRRYVWVVMDVPLGHPVGSELDDRLSYLEPKVVPYGGVTRRIRLTIDSTDALEAGTQALDAMALAIGDWGTMDTAYVDEVCLETAVDERWEAIGGR